MLCNIVAVVLMLFPPPLPHAITVLVELFLGITKP
jgi:hypothetical protein